MATKATPSEVLTPALRKRVFVKVGTFPVKVKKPGGGFDTKQRTSFLKVRKNTADDLNLPIATPAEVAREINGVEVYAQGAKHGRKVLVPAPTGQKTAKGYTRQYEIMFPSSMKISQIVAFFKATKVESFTVKGGGTYGVTK